LSEVAIATYNRRVTIPYGYIGKILRVNLTSGKLTAEELPDSFYRQYFGGEGFVACLLLKEVPAGVEPLSPANKLIFATGPLTGVPAGGCGRHSVGGKSPLTGGFGEAEAGGYWGTELKKAGFDAIIIEGKSEKPCYLFITDGQATIRDASHLWGLKTLECQNAIRQELGDTAVRVAQIGPAGENLVRFACVVHDLDAVAGRTGMGAVMGSKNLKAVACRGHQRLSLADPEAVTTIARWIRDNAPVYNQAFRDFGTAAGVTAFNRKGTLPTTNFQRGSIDGVENISGQAMKDTILVRRRSCFACPVQCKREVRVDTPYTVDPGYGGPEYETIAALGSNCGITDLKAVAKAHELANAYGLDSISTGCAIAFAMECFERGLISSRDTGGLNLHFGNGDAMLNMVEQIARRQGLGDLLAEGTARAAKTIGPTSAPLALHVKGQEIPMHDPRWKPGLGLGYAISPTGADHCHNMHDSDYAKMNPLLKQLGTLGILEPVAIADLSIAKVRLLVYNSTWMHFMNCAVCCHFVMVYGMVGHKRTAELTRAVTGWDTSVFELMKVGEKAMNLARCFNIREGFTSADDDLPERFFTPGEFTSSNQMPLDREAFQQAKEMYYDMMGWPQGSPSTGKLGELGIEWVILR